jgi:predicted branched-subunit amino acid permease
MSFPPPDPRKSTPVPAFWRGVLTAWRSVFAYVLFGTYIGIGALAHDFGFSVGWMVLSTCLIWAAPAQVILISTLGTAASIDIALAVTLSSVRFMPMVVALLPMLKDANTRPRHLIVPAHLTAISVWVEGMRLLPTLPPGEHRIAFFNGLGAGLISPAIAASAVGFYVAGQVPVLFAAGMLFLTPLSMLMSITRNSRQLIDRIALALGLIIGPLLAAAKVGLDLMWTGIIAGTVAYAVHRLREGLS